jgi:S-adenosylmethionine decarboxylase
MVVGISILLDFSGVVDEKFHCASYWEKLLNQAIDIGQMTKLDMSSHQFDSLKQNPKQHLSDLKGGATAFALLAESHISVHTWPEYENVVVDVFTCGSSEHLDNLIKFFQDAVPHSDIQIKRILRGERF